LIRDLLGLVEREFDVLVVGGGIYGLAIAYDAAQRGLSVALVERGDFGAATSFNHLKTIHGGLRYLQTADFTRMRESINERRAFARIAPRFVRPLAFAMPTGSSLTRNPLAWKAALAIDRVVGWRRNEGLDADRHLPPGRVVTGAACERLFDGALGPVSSAAVWHDYEMHESDRLTLSFAKAAAAHGARLANYVEATRLLPRGGSVSGVSARDLMTGGGTFDVRAQVVVNATGPWVDHLGGRADSRERHIQLKAMNLVTSRAARSGALVAPTRAGRALVLLPWSGRTLVGTSESAEEHTPDDQAVSRREVDAFLAEVNDTFPLLGLKSDEITLVHRGIVPAARVNRRLLLLSHPRIIDHAGDGAARLISVTGVKYTTARAVAERVVDLVVGKLGRPQVRCRTAETLLPGAGPIDSPSPSDPIATAVRDEMAHTLVDVVVRRTGLGATGYPGDEAAREVAAAMGRLFRWSDDKLTSELASLRRFYAVTD
jgi:glycerol-3-phosphate dehydrogenase